MKKMVLILLFSLPVAQARIPVKLGLCAASYRHFSSRAIQDGLRHVLHISAFLNPWERFLQIMQTDIYLLVARYLTHGSYQDHCDRVIDRSRIGDHEFKQGKTWLDDAFDGLPSYRAEAGQIVGESFERLKNSPVFLAQSKQREDFIKPRKEVYKDELLLCVKRLIELVQKANQEKSSIIMK